MQELVPHMQPDSTQMHLACTATAAKHRLTCCWQPGG